MSNEAVKRPYYVSVVSTSVNCDFNTIDQCGYRDTSDGAIRWMRTCAMVNDSVQPSDWVDLQGKSGATLKFPKRNSARMHNDVQLMTCCVSANVSVYVESIWYCNR